MARLARFCGPSFFDHSSPLVALAAIPMQHCCSRFG